MDSKKLSVQNIILRKKSEVPFLVDQWLWNLATLNLKDLGFDSWMYHKIKLHYSSLTSCGNEYLGNNVWLKHSLGHATFLVCHK